jgi:hypothetical protein
VWRPKDLGFIAVLGEKRQAEQQQTYRDEQKALTHFNLLIGW